MFVNPKNGRSPEQQAGDEKDLFCDRAAAQQASILPHPLAPPPKPPRNKEARQRVPLGVPLVGPQLAPLLATREPGPPLERLQEQFVVDVSRKKPISRRSNKPHSSHKLSSNRSSTHSAEPSHPASTLKVIQ